MLFLLTRPCASLEKQPRMKHNLRHFLIGVIHRPVVEKQYHSDLGVSNIKLLICSVNKEMKSNKDIVSLFKDGHGINEIQSLLEKNGYSL